MTLLEDDKLDALFDKLSGHADQRILVLARYHHLKPAALEKAATRWPKLNIDFMTMHASKGHGADYVIVLGLQEGFDGFPAPARSQLWSRHQGPRRKISRMRKSDVCCMADNARKTARLAVI